MRRKRQVQASRWLVTAFIISIASQACAGVNIVLPRPDDLVGGSSIACVVEFSRTARPVTRLDFVVDGQVLASKSFSRPTWESGATFVWDATGVPPGKHTLTVRALSGSTPVASDTVEVVVSNEANDVVPPQVHIFSPKPGSEVKGRVPINIHAADNDAVAMVSLFIDKELKLLQNIAPFQYVWDTTRYPNGPHTIEVWAYDRAQNKAEGRPVVVRVANETGRTDLQEHPEAQPAQPSAVAPQTPPPSQQQSPSSPEPQIPPSPRAEAKLTAPTKPSPKPASMPALSVPTPRTSAPNLAKVSAQPRESQVELPSPKVLVAKALPTASAWTDRQLGQSSPRSVEPQAPTRAEGKPKPVREEKPAAATPAKAEKAAAAAPPAQARPAVALPQQKTPSPRLIAKAVPPRAEARPVLPAPRSSQPHTTAPARPMVAKADLPKPPAGPTKAEAPVSVTRPIRPTPTPRRLEIVLNDAKLSLDVPPVLNRGTAFIPLRQVVEKAGGVVMWLPAQKMVRAGIGQTRIQLAIGSQRATVDGKAASLASPAFVRSGRTMVPARFLEDALNLQVVYDPAQKLVRLYLR